jgi:hypothetical protein
MNSEVIDIHLLAEGEDILAGSVEGAAALGKLIATTAQVTDVQLVLLDFRDIKIATSSFLRDAVIGFRDYCRQKRPNLYPVLCNANGKVRQELEGLLNLTGDALVLCEASSRGNIKAAIVIGKLEEKQRLTLQAVLKAGRTDATSLSREYAKEKLGPTAWNNRLSSLLAKGILRETPSGRTKIYEPVVEELSYGA